MAGFVFNPHRPQAKAVSTNAAQHMGNVNDNLQSLLQIGRDIERQENVENEAMARVEAAALVNKNALDMQDIEIKARAKAAQDKFGNDSKLLKITGEQNIKLSTNKQIHDLELEKRRQGFKSSQQLTENAKDIRMEKIKGINSQILDASKVKEIKRKEGVKDARDLRKETVKQMKSVGGVDVLVNKSIEAMEDENLFFDFKLDKKSKRFLSSKLIKELKSNPEEMAKFNMTSGNKESMREYMKDFMDNYGTTVSAPWYNPMSEDKWTPNTIK